ncbi:MAG: ATP-dependent Clp protease adaptor ClpS [Bacteroidales bacterium]|nr:ATP-dependent Clp protease adaptor ClpS [Bacteroidales bacterium]
MQKQRRTNLKERTKEPRRYKVIVLNDDFTTFEFVIMVMQTVFLKTLQQAEEIAQTTHIHKKATVGIYTLDIAKSKVAKATAMARAENFPLSFEIEPE